MLPKRLVRELLCRTDLAPFSAVASDLSELSVRFSARSRCTKREARLARIYNHFALLFASGAVSQVANGCYLSNNFAHVHFW